MTADQAQNELMARGAMSALATPHEPERKAMNAEPKLLYVRAIDYASPNGDVTVYLEMEWLPDGSVRIVRELSSVPSFPSQGVEPK